MAGRYRMDAELVLQRESPGNISQWMPEGSREIFRDCVHPPDTKIQILESSLDFYFIHLYVLPACMSVLHWHAWCSKRPEGAIRACRGWASTKILLTRVGAWELKKYK